MKLKIILILLSALFYSCEKTKTSDNDATSDSLTVAIDSIAKQGHFNGFSVAIVNEKGTLYQKGFGFSDITSKKPYTENTIQNIASVSKTLVGIAVLKAQETGKLKLDDDINKYLPFKVVNPNFPDEKITIRQLATHTSSIIDNDFYLTKNYFLKPGQDLKNAKLSFDDMQVFNPADSIYPMENYLENTLSENGKWNKNSFSASKPGMLYHYSNTATTLAAYIFECATGQSFSAFTQRYILDPLKMNASGWKFEDVNLADHSRLYADPKTMLPFYTSVTYPDGGLITSVNDLSKFLTELIKGYNGNGTILSKESYKEYFKQQLTGRNFEQRNANNPYDESYNVGIFIGFGHSGFIGHTGGDPGVTTILFFDPKTNLGRIEILNTNFSDKAGNDAFYGIWNALEKYQFKLKNRKPVN